MSRVQLLRRRDDYYRHFSVLDIGTEIVKVLSMRRDTSDATVLGVGRERQAAGAMHGGSIANVDSVIDTCNQALEAAEDMAGVVPGQVVVSVGGELVKGFSSTVSYPRERPDAKVRDVELRNLLELVEKRALREAQNLLELERSYGELEARLVHAAITGVRMDGYPMISPIGFQGRNLEVTVFNTFAPRTQVGAVETVVRELDLELLAAVNGPYAVARACASEDTWEGGAIYVDVGGSSTEVALLRGGGVEGTRMFNLGGRTFTRRLALSLGVDQEEAEARKLRHGDGLLAPDAERQVRQVLVADVDVLLQGLNLCLRELSRQEELPPEIYFCGGGSLLPELLDRAADGAWTRGLAFASTPTVARLEPEDVQGVADASGQIDSPQDVGTLSLANHALRIEAEEHDEVNAVMRAVLKGMRM
ncbi:MAG: cell division FtsA domain-containing protein [Candidatus Dormiibacterota bacterium]